jgi:undecaprenyl-diphosphatase
MSELQIVVLALVQGITEFLPISSSAHLILVPVVTGWPDQGLLMDVAVHIGTLAAVLIFFGREVAFMFRGFSDWREPGLFAQPGRRLAGQIVTGTVPVVVAGFLIRGWMGAEGREVALIGWTTLGFGILLYLADRIGGQERRLDDFTFRDAFLIGCAQVLALVPGTSRSGITMTVSRLLGFAREDGARFSLLLAIPTTAAAGTLATYEIIRLGQRDLNVDAVLAAVLACMSALAAIAFLLRWLQRSTFAPFVVYRCVLGVVLLAYAYS